MMRREALEHELARAKEEARALRKANQLLARQVTDLAQGLQPLPNRARELHLLGISNAWISKLLRCTLPEAREMTR